MNNRTLLVVGLLALTGCSTTGLGGASASLGGSATAPAGSQPGGTAISALGGGLVSGSLGSALSESEKRKGLEAEYKALEYTPSGQAVTWRSDRADRYGEVVAAQPYRVGSQDCRQYTHTVFTGGAGAKARGTACRNADGSWTPLT